VSGCNSEVSLSTISPPPPPLLFPNLLYAEQF